MYKRILASLTIISTIFNLFAPVLFVKAETARIWTDKADYSPGETAIIYGSGFNSNADIKISVTKPDNTVDEQTISSDDSGNFQATYFIEGMEGTYTVTATDGINTATTTFTDPLGITVSYNATTYTMTVEIKDMDKGKNYYLKYYSPLGLRATHGPFYMSGTGKWDTTDTLILEPTDQGGKDAWKVELYEGTTLKITKDNIDVLDTVWTTDSTYAAAKTSFTQGETVYVKGIGYDPEHGTGAEKGYWYLKFFYGATLKHTSPWIKATSAWDITYSYTLPSDAPTGTWTIKVYCAEHNTLHGSTTFTVTKLPVSITITSNPTGTNFVKVDNATITTPTTFDWVVNSTHTLEALSPVEGATGTQYVWVNWSDGEDQTHIYTVPTSSETVTANYKTQYKVSFNQDGSLLPPTLTYSIDGGTSTTSTVPFEIWVDASSTIDYQYPAEIYSGLDTRYILFGSSTGSVPVDGPKTITRIYTTQYYLKVNSAYGTTSGEGWYDEGVATSVSVATDTINLAPGERVVFVGWSGDATGTGLTSDPITMDGPKITEALWKTQYLVSFTQTGSLATPALTYSIDGGTSTTSTVPFEIWVDASSSVSYDYESLIYNGTGTRYVLTEVTPTSPQIATSSLTITGTYKTQHYLTVSSLYGTISGEGWYDEGTSTYANLDTGEVVVGGTRYVFVGWSGDATGTNYAQSNPIIMDGPKYVTAIWQVPVGLGISGGLANFSLSVEKTGDGSGTITSNDGRINCGLDCFESYRAGTVVVLTATPGAFSEFVGWGGACSGNQPTCSLSMYGSKIVIAEFKARGEVLGVATTSAPTPSPTPTQPVSEERGTQETGTIPQTEGETQGGREIPPVQETPSPEVGFKGEKAPQPGLGSLLLAGLSLIGNTPWMVVGLILAACGIVYIGVVEWKIRKKKQ
jgi:hypothetical protein